MGVSFSPIPCPTAQIKGPWQQEEDDTVRAQVAIHGAAKWPLIASMLPGRIGKQCRERWYNHLDPSIRNGPWTPEEEELLMRAQAAHGNRWVVIAKLLNGRTDNAIKNHWNSSLSKRAAEGGEFAPRRRPVKKLEGEVAGSEDDEDSKFGGKGTGAEKVAGARWSGLSDYRGVSWDKVTSKWRVRITVNGSRQNVGTFDDDEDAARAFDVAARASGRSDWLSLLNFPTAAE